MKDIQMALDIPPDPAVEAARWCDTTQAVKITGLSRSALYEMRRDGRLKDYRIGNLPVFWRADMLKLAEALKLIRTGAAR